VIDAFGPGILAFRAGEMRAVSRIDGRQKASGMNLSPHAKYKATITSSGAFGSGSLEVAGDTLKITVGHRAFWFMRSPDTVVDWSAEAPARGPVDAGPGALDICGTSIEINAEELTCEEGTTLAFESLRQLPNLRFLVMDSTALESLDGLERYPLLAQLSAAGTAVSRLEVCRALPNLLDLDFSDTKVSDLSPIRDHEFASALDVSGTKVADIGPLAGWHHLNRLNVARTAVRDVSTLANHRYLEELDLSETQVTDIGALEGLRWLRIVSLKGARVPAAQLKTLRTTWEARGQDARFDGCGDVDDDDPLPCVW
jgi:hypothetical protein